MLRISPNDQVKVKKETMKERVGIKGIIIHDVEKKHLMVWVCKSYEPKETSRMQRKSTHKKKLKKRRIKEQKEMKLRDRTATQEAIYIVEKTLYINYYIRENITISEIHNIRQ